MKDQMDTMLALLKSREAFHQDSTNTTSDPRRIAIRPIRPVQQVISAPNVTIRDMDHRDFHN